MPAPDFSFEDDLYKRGFKFIGGADEVGRGAFAGPLVVAVVVLPRKIKIPSDIRIDDSKRLSPNKREEPSLWIKENAVSWGVGEVSVEGIENLGITGATHSGFRRAVTATVKTHSGRLDYLLIDAFYIPRVRDFPISTKTDKSRQLAIPKGDSKSFSIAAASIVAKVYRDNLMREIHKEFPKYDWKNNKGYGTKKHRDAIATYGITKHHRNSFVESSLKRNS